MTWNEQHYKCRKTMCVLDSFYINALRVDRHLRDPIDGAL